MSKQNKKLFSKFIKLKKSRKILGNTSNLEMKSNGKPVPMFYKEY